MLEFFAPLRTLSVTSVLLRLFLAILVGGVIGLERGRKGRAAGFRTYMIVCLGAALTMLLGQYHTHQMSTVWAGLTQNITADVSRFSAQVINGVGFLGAGTIILTGRREVKGLTTAAGLWASACVGLAVGAGFYECVLLGFFLIIICVRLLPAVETLITENSPNMDIYVEFHSLDDVGDIINRIKAMDINIYEMDISHGRDHASYNPYIILSIRLPRKQMHSEVLAALSELKNIYTIDEM